jgi:hypothetical protein
LFASITQSGTRFPLFALAFLFKAMPDLVHGNAAERQACGSFKLRNIHLIQVTDKTAVHGQGFHNGSQGGLNDDSM